MDIIFVEYAAAENISSAGSVASLLQIIFLNTKITLLSKEYIIGVADIHTINGIPLVIETILQEVVNHKKTLALKENILENFSITCAPIYPIPNSILAQHHFHIQQVTVLINSVMLVLSVIINRDQLLVVSHALCA